MLMQTTTSMTDSSPRTHQDVVESVLSSKELKQVITWLEILQRHEGHFITGQPEVNTPDMAQLESEEVP